MYVVHTNYKYFHKGLLCERYYSIEGTIWPGALEPFTPAMCSNDDD